METDDDILKLGIFFLLLLTAWSSQALITIYIFQNLNLAQLGPIAFFCRYLTYTLGTLIAPTLRINLKTQMLMACMAFVINFAISMLITFSHSTGILITICLGFSLDGFGNGLIWVAKARYMHLVCQIKSIHEKRGEAMAIFQFIFCLSALSGAFVTFMFVGYSDLRLYFAVLVILGFLSFLFGLFHIKEIGEIGRQEIEMLELSHDQDRHEKQAAIIVMMRNQTISCDANPVSVEDILKQVLKEFNIITFILPLFIIKGLSVGVRENHLMHLVPFYFPLALRDKIAGSCQILAAVGSIIGGYLSSYLTDKIGTIWVGRILVVILSFSLGLFVLARQVENIGLIYSTSFLIGFITFGLESYALVVVSRHFEGRASVFSLTIFTYSLTLVVFNLAMLISQNVLPNYMIIIIAIATLFFIILLNRLQFYGNCYEVKDEQYITE